MRVPPQVPYTPKAFLVKKKNDDNSVMLKKDGKCIKKRKKKVIKKGVKRNIYMIYRKNKKIKEEREGAVRWILLF